MKTRNVAILLGLAAIGIGGVILYRRNLKKIEKIEETEKEELSALGVEPEKLEEDAVKISKNHPDYGDLKRFSDLPIPQQIVRLFNCSSNWSDEDLDWETAYTMLVANGFLMGDMPSSDSVWGATLRQHGFYRESVPNTCPDCYTAEDFCNEHPLGTYVLGFGGHTACVKDGILFDSWDSSELSPQFYWRKG